MKWEIIIFALPVSQSFGKWTLQTLKCYVNNYQFITNQQTHYEYEELFARYWAKDKAWLKLLGEWSLVDR